MRYLILAAIILALPGPALARAHYHTGHSHHADADRHYRAVAARWAVPSRHRVAHYRLHRRGYAATPAAYGAPFGAQSPSGFALPTQPWQQRAAGETKGTRSFFRFPLSGQYGERFEEQHARAQADRRARGYADENFGQHSQLEGLIAQQAGANGVPAALVHRVIMRESGGNPGAVSSGNYGLMQIRLATARAMGYGGSGAGLLDPATNMTYAVRYLAGAYRAAGGDQNRAVALYARGYNAAPVRSVSLDPALQGQPTAPMWDYYRAPFGAEQATARARHYGRRAI